MGGTVSRDAVERGVPAKLDALHDDLKSLDGLIVGFSGGVDSALLLRAAVDALGDRAVALTAVSPSLPRSEVDEAVRLASSFGARHELIESSEIHNPAYAANPTNRCFHCKEALFEIAAELRERTGIAHIALGTNLDDLGDHRPGLQSAKKHGALHPLVDAGFTKADVREAAKLLEITVWDKPAYACLSSRFPYGTPITEQRLLRVGACEQELKALGFRVFRVRFHNELARIEIGEAEIDRALEPAIRAEIVARCKAHGFRFVCIDLEPYRSGRLNEGVVTRGRARRR